MPAGRRGRDGMEGLRREFELVVESKRKGSGWIETKERKNTRF